MGRLKESRHRLQVLPRRLVEVQETERRHLARELHEYEDACKLHYARGLKPGNLHDSPDRRQRLQGEPNLEAFVPQAVKPPKPKAAFHVLFVEEDEDISRFVD